MRLTALRVEASAALRRPAPSACPGGRAKPGALVPVHSVVVVLRGRQELWPEVGEYGTDWPELPWSGTRLQTPGLALLPL
jgi:hypothetical protein